MGASKKTLLWLGRERGEVGRDEGGGLKGGLGLEEGKGGGSTLVVGVGWVEGGDGRLRAALGLGKVENGTGRRGVVRRGEERGWTACIAFTSP